MTTSCVCVHICTYHHDHHCMIGMAGIVKAEQGMTIRDCPLTCFNAVSTHHSNVLVIGKLQRPCPYQYEGGVHLSVEAYGYTCIEFTYHVPNSIAIGESLLSDIRSAQVGHGQYEHSSHCSVGSERRLDFPFIFRLQCWFAFGTPSGQGSHRRKFHCP